MSPFVMFFFWGEFLSYITEKNMDLLETKEQILTRGANIYGGQCILCLVAQAKAEIHLSQFQGNLREK